ncbi:glycosyltransferase family protein [Flavobacterium restrictum]|uniref:Glycosyltransferase n=1 Tax=Flavobacterium restrictum TaxID=2594428 RepID=A0A553E8C4_9FLAO|nr:glycosyltransferase [Flavobacterium restrictum]TRX41245.1 glycosyltransferase [Flavobacterium restrictum]
MKKYINKLLFLIGLNDVIEKIRGEIKFYYQYYYNKIFNQVVRNQNKNYKTIPILIISYNQLFYLKKLIEFLTERKYTNIVILDNNSTYEPLLDYFKTIESKVVLHRLNENLGHLVFWKNKELFDKYSKGYYVITDADVVPVVDCPESFLLYFKTILDFCKTATKVGFSLKIDDLPTTNLNREKIIKWESQFWKNKDHAGNFIADIDTTFALYRPNYNYNEFDFYSACRTPKPFTAHHGGWYVNSSQLTKEQQFYFETCNESSSWRIDKNGDLRKNIYN